MALFSHSALPKAMEVITDTCKDLSKGGESRSESSVGGTQETRAPYGSTLNLAETVFGPHYPTCRHKKSQAALTSLEDSHLCNWRSIFPAFRQLFAPIMSWSQGPWEILLVSGLPCEV